MRNWILATVMFATIPAAAIPGAGLGSAIIPRPVENPNGAPRTEDPALVLEQGVENMFGVELNGAEQRELKKMVRELEQIQIQQERPQKVNFVMDFFSQNEFRPIICVHFRGSLKIPALGKVTINAGGAIERTGCILTNTGNPWYWDYTKFQSYRMSGAGGLAGTGGAPWGGAGAGVSGGIYFGPKNTTRPFIGTYKYLKLSMDKGVASGYLMGAYADTERGRQGMLMLGGGGEIGWTAMMRFVKVLPKLEPGQASVLGFKVELGSIYNISEHPWYSRMLSGMNPISALSDFETYVAAN